MKYDDASWHYGGDFPAELPPEAGATHIGMFVAWALTNGLAGELHTQDSPDDLANLHDRRETPGNWFIRNCDEKFTNEDLDEEGNAFARDYYQATDAQTSPYLADYTKAFPRHPDLYSVPDTWETYDRIAPLISRGFSKWRGDERSLWSRLFGD